MTLPSQSAGPLTEEIIHGPIASKLRRLAALELENSKLKGQLEEAVAALEPFAREEFCVELGGNVEGDMSPVFARNHAMLRIGDFRAARDLLSKLKEAGS